MVTRSVPFRSRSRYSSTRIGSTLARSNRTFTRRWHQPAPEPQLSDRRPPISRALPISWAPEAASGSKGLCPVGRADFLPERTLSPLCPFSTETASTRSRLISTVIIFLPLLANRRAPLRSSRRHASARASNSRCAPACLLYICTRSSILGYWTCCSKG